MKYGMNLLLWTDHVTDEHVGVLEMLKAQGYDGVEIPLFQLDPDHYAKLGKRLDAIGLERTGVTVRGADNNPISPDPAIRRKGVEQSKLTLDCCQAAGLTVLAGPYHSAIGEFTGKGPTQDEWKWGVESMQQVADYADKANVVLAVECLNRFECYFLNTHADSVRFVRDVDHPHCRMMYDTFHAHIEEKDPAAAIRGCADHMAHVHISESDRSTPGKGQVAWGPTFAELKKAGYDGWLMIEAFGMALPALAAATKIWRRMFQTEEQLAREGLAFMKKNWA